MATRMLLLADTHVPKRAKRLPEAVLRAVDEADIVVHAGMRLLNPGSPTDRRRRPARTMIWVEVDGAAVDATLVPLS
ncbi:hypothetical protein NS234_17290 [Microbacterium oxydans]|uniref:metallophosphatase family protein n=1 Tax=Microbacterium oxydans TaxID=82380 RepID=UPI000733D304|nr:metallophosphatase family protein [Microbacterium oxydans]KTR74978.1 hypothetical protein NS234_17290 [Microbacterium oxydans]